MNISLFFFRAKYVTRTIVDSLDSWRAWGPLAAVQYLTSLQNGSLELLSCFYDVDTIQ